MNFLTTKQKGTKDDPWILKTPSGTSEFKAYKDEKADPPAIVVWVGKTELKYQLRALDDLHKMLKSKGDWMPLGSADEQKPVEEGTVEAWGRSPKNPVGGMVWTQERLARKICKLCTTYNGGFGAS